jgi:hypothetical protein
MADDSSAELGVMVAQESSAQDAALDLAFRDVLVLELELASALEEALAWEYHDAQPAAARFLVHHGGQAVLVLALVPAKERWYVMMVHAYWSDRLRFLWP